MPWFKVDDGLAFHRKVVAAGNAAMGLWVRAGSWAAHELTDGFVPDHMVSVIGTPAQAERLVKSGLWMRTDGGFQFHQWNEEGRQPTSGEVRAERERNAARQAEFRKKRRAQKNLAKTTALQDGRTAEKIFSGSDEAFPDEPQVDTPRNGVTPPLVTPLVTGGVTAPRPDPTRTSSYEEVDVPPTAGAAAPTLAPAAPPATTDALIAEWLDHCRRRPPGQVIGQVGKALKVMLAEGVDPADVRAGLAAWADKGLHPSTLPSVVNEVMNRPATPALHAVNGGRTSSPRRVPTTTQRVNDALAFLRPGED